LRCSLSSGVLTSRVREPGLGPDTIATYCLPLTSKVIGGAEKPLAKSPNLAGERLRDLLAQGKLARRAEPMDRVVQDGDLRVEGVVERGLLVAAEERAKGDPQGASPPGTASSVSTAPDLRGAVAMLRALWRDVAPMREWPPMGGLPPWKP
jgi:hypothetical protein